MHMFYFDNYTHGGAQGSYAVPMIGQGWHKIGNCIHLCTIPLWPLTFLKNIIHYLCFDFNSFIFNYSKGKI